MAAVEAESGKLDASELRQVQAVRTGFSRFEDGDVLFAKITPCMENGKFAVARELHGGRAAGSTEFHVLRPSTGMNSKLLLYYLLRRSFRNDARRAMKGAAGQLRVALNFLDEAPLALPPSPEQDRIVAAIEEQFTRLDAAVAGLKRIQHELKRYRASVLKAACEGRLVPNEADLARAEGREYEPADRLLERILAERRARWEADQLESLQAAGRLPMRGAWKAKYEEPATPNAPELWELPEGWRWTMPNMVCRRVENGNTPPSDRMSASGEVPFIKVYNLTQDGRLNHGYRSTFISRETHEMTLKRSRIYPGDVLMNIVGPPLGKVSLVPDTYPEWNTNRNYTPTPVGDRSRGMSRGSVNLLARWTVGSWIG
jgi:type I restriction enzyme S subunit